jgi:putative endonuclease
MLHGMNEMSLARGMAAEQLAADYLQSRGLTVLARNLRCKAGELDLVCLDQDVLAVIEVRQRSGADFGGAIGSVTWHKQRKIIRATQFFLAQQARWRALRVRFDVFAIEGPLAQQHRIVWVRDAFRVT